jgi:mannose PTS system EIIA component
MIGILVVTHENLGDSLIKTAAAIMQKGLERLLSISIDIKEDPEKLMKKIKDGIKKVNKSNGVLILTDMFGGSPSNLSYSFLKEGEVEVLSGINLPILIKALNMRENIKLSDIGAALETYGKDSISLASNILKK